MKYIKANIGFLISMIVIGVIALNPETKSFILKGLIKSGLYKPSFAALKSSSNIEVPSVIFRSASGEHIDIADTKGKVIFVNFWAKWCPPCLAEMPTINKLAEYFKGEKEVIFLMVNVDGELEASDSYFKKKNYNLRAFVPAGTLPEEIFKGTLPTTVVINKKGELVYQHEGLADYNSKETKEFIKGL